MAYILLIIIICNYFIGNMILASMMHQYNLLTKGSFSSQAAKNLGSQKKKLVLLKNDLWTRLQT